MTSRIQNIGLDSDLPSEQVDSRMADLELLQRTNLGKTTEHDGYGMKLRADDQQFTITDEIYLAKDRSEIQTLCDKIAADADITVYNSTSNGVLEYVTSIFNYNPIVQLLQTTASRELTHDWQQGTFGTTNIFIPQIAHTGKAALYSDQGGSGQTGVNYTWLERQCVALQQNLIYGDMTVARFGMGKINYVADLRTSLTTTINQDINHINFRGYAGMRIFGLLNDPDLRTVLVAPASAANPSSSQWIYKTYLEICSDVQAMYADILGAAQGNADYKVKATLGVPPSTYVYLTTQNALGNMLVSDFLTKAYPGLVITQVQDYAGTGNPIGSSVPNHCQLIFDTLANQPVAYNIFSQLYNSHGVVRLASAYEEKVSYTVSGALIAQPIGVSTMTGI